MKKLSTATDLGGAPINKNDLRDIFNVDIWAAVQALLSPFDTDTQGIIVSGCVTTANAGNFDMTAGVVYLNGEFMRIAAVTNQTFTKYIAPSAPVSDSRTFADGTTHAVMITSDAGLVGSAPGSGQYVTISSLTDLDDRRWSRITTNKQIATVFQLTLEALGGLRTEGSGAYLKTKIVDIGDWNMDSTDAVTVTHGISDFTKIRSISGFIRNDANDKLFPLWSDQLFSPPAFGVNPLAALQGVNATVINIARTTGGYFDGVTFDSTSYNRGWVTIVYEA